MARFILDVANLNAEQIKEVMKVLDRDELLCDSVSSIVCIDETNNNQFHHGDANDTYMNNVLSDEQIENYNNFLKKCCE